MKTIRIALDWTPNTNHTGFYVAKALEYYENKGLDVDIVTPLNDDYKVTPAKKVELGQVDFAICPMESVLSYRTKQKPFNLIAVSALLQEDLSAITVLQSSGIKRPRELDGKSYASYKARYEDGIVKQMIKNDGGNGNLEISYPEKLGIWDTLLNSKADATWIFLNWEALQAKAENIELFNFKLKSFDIPYSYSPVLVANEDGIEKHLDDYKAFVEATRKGFLYAKDNPSKAVDILKPHIPKKDQNIDLLESQTLVSQYYGTKNEWGRMKVERIQKFLEWIYEHNLESKKVTAQELFTNRFL